MERFSVDQPVGPAPAQASQSPLAGDAQAAKGDSIWSLLLSGQDEIVWEGPEALQRFWNWFQGLMPLFEKAEPAGEELTQRCKLKVTEAKRIIARKTALCGVEQEGRSTFGKATGRTFFYE